MSDGMLRDHQQPGCEPDQNGNDDECGFTRPEDPAERCKTTGINRSRRAGD
jgi:hypothetical protein